MPVSLLCPFAPLFAAMSAPSTPRARPATICHARPIRVCVCGASGTVGSLTVHALAACGVNLAIRAGCESSSLQSDTVQSYRTLYGGEGGEGGEGVEVAELDYQSVESLERLLQGIERVFVVVPWSRQAPAVFDNLLVAAKRQNVHFICKMSSAMALLPAQQPPSQPTVALPQFASDHAACDAALSSSGVAYCVINSNVLFDNLLKFQAAHVKKERALVGLDSQQPNAHSTRRSTAQQRGTTQSQLSIAHRPALCACVACVCVPTALVGADAAVSYIDARDVADCVLSVMLNPTRYQSRHLHLTGKEAVTGSAIAEAMSRCYQTSIAYSVVGEAEVRAMLERVGVPSFMADDVIALEHVRNTGQLAHITSTVKDVAGHPPRSLESFASAYKQQLSPGFSLKQVLNFFV